MRTFIFGLCLCLLCLTGCVKQQPSPTLPKDNEATWQKFLANSTPHNPYRLQLSLRLGMKGDTRRVTAILWGADTNTIRLDAMAGVGSVIAKIYDDRSTFLLVAPVDGKAYTHQGSNKPMLKIGIPLPLTLKNLADLLTGNPAAVFGRTHGQVTEGSKGYPSYALAERIQGAITLDGQGRVLTWLEKPQGRGWNMQIEYADDNLPSRINLENTRGERAVLLVKEREAVTTIDKSQLNLTIPQGVKVLPLAQYTAQTE
ncbi:MAG: hypothetical protein IJU79_05985 [Desulfovibrionaceae bacterium]|nr:hypothetical protein [Desulfovibrionaceae bacterium]